MSLIERDFKRAAQAVIRRHGDAAAISVERYIMLLRRENRHDLADDWARIAKWIEAMGSRAVH